MLAKNSFANVLLPPMDWLKLEDGKPKLTQEWLWNSRDRLNEEKLIHTKNKENFREQLIQLQASRMIAISA